MFTVCPIGACGGCNCVACMLLCAFLDRVITWPPEEGCDWCMWLCALPCVSSPATQTHLDLSVMPSRSRMRSAYMCDISALTHYRVCLFVCVAAATDPPGPECDAVTQPHAQRLHV
jgi:hypothetical protein